MNTSSGNNEGMHLLQEFSCKAIIDPSLKRTMKPFSASRCGKNKGMAIERASGAEITIKEAKAKNSKRKKRAQ